MMLIMLTSRLLKSKDKMFPATFEVKKSWWWSVMTRCVWGSDDDAEDEAGERVCVCVCVCVWTEEEVCVCFWAF